MRAGMNARGVTDIESGASRSPTLLNAMRLADALGVSLFDLLGEDARQSINQEWSDFLAQFDADDQRKILDAVKSLRPAKDESKA